MESVNRRITEYKETDLRRERLPPSGYTDLGRRNPSVAEANNTALCRAVWTDEENGAERLKGETSVS